MDYKKIFNEANLEKQEESLSRMNECGRSDYSEDLYVKVYGGCGGDNYKLYNPIRDNGCGGGRPQLYKKVCTFSGCGGSSYEYVPIRESLSRFNECGGGYGGSYHGGCGGGYASGRGYSLNIPDLKFDQYTPNAIFKHLSSLKKFANVDRKYMKGWCTRNAYICQSTGDATKRFERALKEKEAREQAAATKKAGRQTIIDNFGLTEEQIKAARNAKSLHYKVEEAKSELDAAQARYDNIVQWEEKTWERAGGKELWDEILANGYELN